MRYEIRDEIREKFEIYDYCEAAELLDSAFNREWVEILDCLSGLEVAANELKEFSGDRRAVPQRIDDMLYPKGWKRLYVFGDMEVGRRKKRNVRNRFLKAEMDEEDFQGFVNDHNVIFLKSRVAFAVEWNGREDAFRRGLSIIRSYFDCGMVEVAVVVVRYQELSDIYARLGLMTSLGERTTWLGRALLQLRARSNGECPILAVGLKDTKNTGKK